jgi:hypothetical protein
VDKIVDTARGRRNDRWLLALRDLHRENSEKLVRASARASDRRRRIRFARERIAQATAEKALISIHMRHSFAVDMCIEKTRKP